MTQTFQRTFLATAAMAVAAGALLAGCEQKTTTTDTPAGTSTTTSVSPMAGASAAMSRAGDAATDAALTAKVKTALLADPDVKGLQINVETQDAAVTLTGSSDNQANLDRAVTVAKGVDGVKSVDSRLTVGSAAATTSRAMGKAADVVGDAAITAKVKTALLADADVKGLKIDVDTRDGVVTLTGELAGSGNVDKAVTIAKGIDGVKSVQNRLKSTS